MTTKSAEAREAKASESKEPAQDTPKAESQAVTDGALDDLEKRAITAINTLLDVEQEVMQIRDRDEGKPHHQRCVNLASALTQVENVRDDTLSAMPNARLTLQ